MKTILLDRRSMPATLVKYASFVPEVHEASSRDRLRSLLARLAGEDLHSMTLDQFELTTMLEAYPFEHFLDDPAAELYFRIDRNNFNVSVAGNTAWDSDVHVPSFDQRNGFEFHVIEGERIVVFAAERYRTLDDLIGRLSSRQALKCLLAVEQCRDQLFNLTVDDEGRQVYERRRRQIFGQMQSGELEGWLDDWSFRSEGND